VSNALARVLMPVIVLEVGPAPVRRTMSTVAGMVKSLS
jgi:hypothetical protein